MLIGVGRVLCRFSYYLYVSCSGLNTLLGEERANFSAIIYLYVCGFCSEGFPLPLVAWDRLLCFIVALPVPSI